MIAYRTLNYNGERIIRLINHLLPYFFFALYVCISLSLLEKRHQVNRKIKLNRKSFLLRRCNVIFLFSFLSAFFSCSAILFYGLLYLMGLLN